MYIIINVINFWFYFADYEIESNRWILKSAKVVWYLIFGNTEYNKTYFDFSQKLSSCIQLLSKFYWNQF